MNIEFYSFKFILQKIYKYRIMITYYGQRNKGKTGQIIKRK